MVFVESGPVMSEEIYAVVPLPPLAEPQPPTHSYVDAFALQNSRRDPPPIEQLPALTASVTMNTFPTLPAAAGRFATVDSGGLHCPPEKLLYPVHVLAPESVGNPLVSEVGRFHRFAAPQNHKSWFVVSMYNTGGVQLPLGAPLPVVVVVVDAPLICVQAPGVPVVVQK
jgi:hypothetical protein